MKKTLGITAVIALLICGVLVFGRGDNSDDFNAKPQSGSSSKSPTSAHDRSDINSSSAQEGRAFEEIEALMASVPEIEAPRVPNIERQESRMAARASANMSDAQMIELQNLRKGERVRRVDGTLMPPYTGQEVCNDEGLCRLIITNAATGAIVYDGEWATEFTPTGIGQEVVKNNNNE